MRTAFRNWIIAFLVPSSVSGCQPLTDADAVAAVNNHTAELREALTGFSVYDAVNFAMFTQTHAYCSSTVNVAFTDARPSTDPVDYVWGWWGRLCNGPEFSFKVRPRLDAAGMSIPGEHEVTYDFTSLGPGLGAARHFTAKAVLRPPHLSEVQAWYDGHPIDTTGLDLPDDELYMGIGW